MASLDVVNIEREKVGEVELPPAIFEAKVNKALLHEVVTLSQSNQRAGTRMTKGRSAVSGGGRKPWKQKGTGRARAGSNRSPIWRGGGAVFGPQPYDYDIRIPRKKRRAALRAALTWKFKSDCLTVIDGLEIIEGKTKEVAPWMDRNGWREGGVLLVHAGEIPLLSRAARNLAGVKVIRSEGISLYDLFVFRNLLMTKEAFAKVGEAWAK
jgi:large subunit ribosomal protein L4